MDREKADWIEQRTTDIVAIAEAHATELAAAVQDHIKLIASSHEDRDQRQLALMKPSRFANQLLTAIAGVIAETEYDADKDTYPQPQLVERVRESIRTLTQMAADREAFRSGQGRAN